MITPRLHPSTLGDLPREVARPLYERAALHPGIGHLGLGSFARAHLAVANEAAIHSSGDPRFGIVGVSLRSAAVRDALAVQQGLYTVARSDIDEQGRPRQRLQVVGNLIAQLVAPEDPAAVLAAIARPAARIVSLTITEKGYHRDPASGSLDLAHPQIEYDLQHAEAPHSAIGFIVRGLALRRAHGLPPLTLMSLDNLPHNGRTLQSLTLTFARRVDAGLADWIQTHCTFPSSMVDRIVPRTTDSDRERVAAALDQHDAWPVPTEPFFDWAVEDRFAAGRPDWDQAGARFVADATSWERLKLRAVNGCHSAIAYLGAMAGWAAVDEAVAQPEMQRYLQALLAEEVQPTLSDLPGLDFSSYARGLLQRFANPALAHRTQQIAMDGSMKLPQRLLETVTERLAVGQPIARLALAIAAWMHYLRGVDEWGRAYAVEDPWAEALVAARAAAEQESSLRERVAAFTQFAPVFGELAGHATLVDALTKALESLQTVGVRLTLARWGRME